MASSTTRKLHKKHKKAISDEELFDFENDYFPEDLISDFNSEHHDFFGDSFDEMSLSELKSLASDLGLEVGEKTKKELLQILQAALSKDDDESSNDAVSKDDDELSDEILQQDFDGLKAGIRAGLKAGGFTDATKEIEHVKVALDDGVKKVESLNILRSNNMKVSKSLKSGIEKDTKKENCLERQTTVEEGSKENIFPNLNLDSNDPNALTTPTQAPVTFKFPANTSIGIRFTGWEIKSVRIDSPADKAGVRKGARILSINNVPVDNSTHMIKELFHSLKDKVIELKIDLRFGISPSTQLISMNKPVKNVICKPLMPEESKKWAPKIIFKVLVVGNARSGKSSIINRLVNNRYNPNEFSTIGCDFHRKEFQREDQRVKLRIFDIAGQDRYVRLTRAFYKEAQGVIIVCDISRSSTLTAVEQWKNAIDDSLILEQKMNGCEVPVVLIANKIDLLEGDTRSFLLKGAEIQTVAHKTGVDAWFVGSAKDNKNITEAFDYLITRMLEERSRQSVDGSFKDTQKSFTLTADDNLVDAGNKKKSKCCE